MEVVVEDERPVSRQCSGLLVLVPASGSGTRNLHDGFRVIHCREDIDFRNGQRVEVTKHVGSTLHPRQKRAIA